MKGSVSRFMLMIVVYSRIRYQRLVSADSNRCSMIFFLNQYILDTSNCGLPEWTNSIPNYGFLFIFLESNPISMRKTSDSSHSKTPIRKLLRFTTVTIFIFKSQSHDGSVCMLYMATFIVSIYPSHVSIYTPNIRIRHGSVRPNPPISFNVKKAAFLLLYPLGKLKSLRTWTWPIDSWILQ